MRNINIANRPEMRYAESDNVNPLSVAIPLTAADWPVSAAIQFLLPTGIFTLPNKLAVFKVSSQNDNEFVST